MKRLLVDVLRTARNKPGHAILGIFGLLFLFAWAIFPIPSREDLAEVDGSLQSYSVETDQAWFAQFRRGGPKVYVLFKVTDSSGRFWSDAVYPSNVREVFPRMGMALRFHRLSHGWIGVVNGDARKTWGLSVDGLEIESLDEAIAHDTFFEHVLFPVLGALSLITAIWWLRKDLSAANSA